MAVWPAGKHFQCLSTPWLAQAGLAQRPGKGPLDTFLVFLGGRLGRPEVPLKNRYILVFLEGRPGRPEVPLKNLYIPCVSTPP